MKGTSGTKRNPPPGQQYVGQRMQGTFDCSIAAPGHVKCDFHEPRYAGQQPVQSNPRIAAARARTVVSTPRFQPSEFRPAPPSTTRSWCGDWCTAAKDGTKNILNCIWNCNKVKEWLEEHSGGTGGAPSPLPSAVAAQPGRGCKGCIPACDWPREYCKCGTCKDCPGKDCGKYDRSATETHARSLQANPAPQDLRLTPTYYGGPGYVSFAGLGKRVQFYPTAWAAQFQQGGQLARNAIPAIVKMGPRQGGTRAQAMPSGRPMAFRPPAPPAADDDRAYIFGDPGDRSPSAPGRLMQRNPVFYSQSPIAPVGFLPPNEVARVRAFSSGGGPMGAYYRCMQHQYDMGVRGPARAQACAPMLPR